MPAGAAWPSRGGASARAGRGPARWPRRTARSRRSASRRRTRTGPGPGRTRRSRPAARPTRRSSRSGLSSRTVSAEPPRSSRATWLAAATSGPIRKIASTTWITRTARTSGHPRPALPTRSARPVGCPDGQGGCPRRGPFDSGCARAPAPNWRNSGTTGPPGRASLDHRGRVPVPRRGPCSVVSLWPHRCGRRGGRRGVAVTGLRGRQLHRARDRRRAGVRDHAGHRRRRLRRQHDPRVRRLQRLLARDLLLPGRQPGLHPGAVAVPRDRARRRRGPDRDLPRLPDDRHGRQRERDRGHQALARRHLLPRPGCCPPRPRARS